LISFEDSLPEGGGLLVLGGPSFDTSSQLEFDEALHRLKPELFAQALDSPTPFRGMRSDCPNFKDVRFKPLPASAEETERIATLWERTVGPDQTVCRLTGDEANEGSVKRLAPGRRILHLATHGFFLGETCLAGPATGRGISRLAPSLTESVSVAADGSAEGILATSAAAGLVRESGTDSLSSRQVTNPLLLSGIALAGANRREFVGPDEDDGILTAEEIASLNLSGVEWAVLSACNTGLGEIGTGVGEGVFGLRRALQVAGARTVILSLWDLRDEVALRWMELLYEARLRDRLDTAQAVHTATLGLLRERRAAGESTHPFYWAGLVAAGDWH
ncbi:CHAT domain-containing protein, partial [Candidatus Eisenbacteria bacterium]